MKLKMIAAALAFAAAGNANALITDGSGGNGELFLTVWNQDAQISYTRDLNVTLNDFLAGVALGSDWNFAADANMTSFLGMAGGSDNLLFAIGAMDTTGTNTTDHHRYITTASVIDLGNTVTNLNLKDLGTNGAQLLANSNGLLGGSDSLIVTDTAIIAYAGSAQWGTNWGGAFNGTSTANVGDSVGMYFLRQSTGAFAQRNNPSIYAALEFSGNPYTASLDAAGNLTVTAVPEPEAYALMLAGLGLVGFMARRRKSV
jgi:hypothetical protein